MKMWIGIFWTLLVIVLLVSIIIIIFLALTRQLSVTSDHHQKKKKHLNLSIQERGGCSVHINDLNIDKKQPLYLNPKTEQLITTQNGEIKVADGESIELFCSSGFEQPYTGNVVTVHCNDGQFKVNDGVIDWECLSCREKIMSIVQQTNINCTETGGTIHEIGFETHRGFMGLMSVCHECETCQTHWVDHILTPEVKFPQKTAGRSNKFQGDYFKGLSLNKLYGQTSQQKTIASILQSDDLGNQLISQEDNLFISAGHGASYSDYQFNTHKNATNHYLNINPQFQSFNGANWNITELRLRDFVNENQVTARVRTGVYGTLELNDVNGNPTPISLSPDGRIRVPKIFYKIVIVEGLPSVVFVGVNNPYATLEEIDRDYTFCRHKIPKAQLEKDYGFRMRWSDDLKKGHMYACHLDDFKDHLPQLCHNLPK